MNKIIQFSTEDNKLDYIDLNIRMVKNMDFYKNRISKSKYLIALYVILIFGFLYLIFFNETSILRLTALFALLFLLYSEIMIKPNLIKRAKKIYSNEFDFISKTTNYTITNDFIESTCDFQTLKFHWADLTNYSENSEEIELDFFKKGMLVLRKKSIREPNNFIDILNDIKFILRDNPLVIKNRHFA
ncbi:hypothetical protein [Leptospira paudalimensis]|uniref:YcxB-like protein domain-containing protein n=1 Tax=Leptospira paudalimensis TaxID=2950024 RepID=A0ABT3M574_9LEPT|nr:hypothetical protein [Leptospira paudalimensis]MCW7503540.1 hypothetical protein [Leptospira paudalimensis]